jgi:TPP-dependent pyruvate/acetoin dehydrogenase alpha subunit
MTDQETKLWIYRKMVEIRCFEEASIPYFLKPGHGSHHPCIGHEAVEAAIGAVLRKEDYLFGSHRSHGIVLTKGLAPKFVMAELWGKTTGYCHGRGGSMHITDVNNHVMASGIVGSCISLAVGAALAIKLRGEKAAAVASFGEGAANCGAFHEGLNMAALWDLPAVFICENNGLAVTTHMKDSTSTQTVSERASAYSVLGCEIDGTDPLECYDAISGAVERARADGIPSLISASVPWDEGAYLTEAELKAMRDSDPLPKYRRRLVEEGLLTPEVADAIDQDMKALMGEATHFAEESPSPEISVEEAVKYVYVD